MIDQTFVLLYRSLIDSEDWLAEKFTRGQAWVDLIMLANWKPGHIRKRGIKIPLDRGHVGHSQLTLSERWKWSRGKVKRFLNDLESDHQIEQQINKVTTLIYIVNYDQYQSRRTSDDTTNGHQTDIKRTSNGTGTKKNNKNNKNNNKNTNASTGIDIDKTPEGISKESAQHFIYHRIKIKAPLTQHGFNLAMKNALNASQQLNISADKCIDEAIEAGWKGIKAEWLANRLNRPLNNNNKDFTDGDDGFN